MYNWNESLADTEKLYTAATDYILEKFDKKYSWEMKLSVMGMQHMDICQRMVEHYDLPITPQEYSRLQRQYNEVHMQEAELMPGNWSISVPLEASTSNFQCCQLFPCLGAEQLIKHLHRNNIPMCLATSSNEDIVRVKISNHLELFSLLHHRVCGSSDPEVKHGKPAPDIFLVAASRFPDKPSPDKCLVFEDAPNGVTAALKAGMQVVMVPDPRIGKDLCKRATCYINSLQDFQPELFGLPAFFQA